MLSALCCFLFKNELSAATHLTSRLLKEYDKQVGLDISSIETESPIHPHCFCCLQRFPLGGDDEVMSSTLQQFAKVIDEVRKHTNHQSSVTID